MNIILDMDGTLIDEHMNPRPHLDLFFRYIFAHFDHVSIWTFASVNWFSQVFEKTLKHFIPPGKGFHFVWCRIHCKMMEITPPMSMFLQKPGFIVIKPLSTVFKTFPTIYLPTNTIFIDDTPSTYSQNKQNAIPITSFHDNNLFDNELLRIINYMIKCNPFQIGNPYFGKN
jgi:hypothetical protein